MNPARPLLIWLIACYAFLYAPIAFLVVLSFNASRMVTAGDGFSLRWYATLAHDSRLIDAALLSLRIAAASATIALVVGTLAGTALARFGRFRGRAAFEAAIAAPLVMPEVLTGLSLLLLFVALEQATGWPAGRGAGTITLAHASGVQVSGSGITFTAALTKAHAAGALVGNSGPTPGAPNQYSRRN